MVEDRVLFSLELLKSTLEKVMADMEDTMKEIVELLKPKVDSDILVLLFSSSCLCHNYTTNKNTRTLGDSHK